MAGLIPAGMTLGRALSHPLLADHGSVPQFDHSLCRALVYRKNLTFISAHLNDHVRCAQPRYEGLIRFGVYCVGMRQIDPEQRGTIIWVLEDIDHNSGAVGAKALRHPESR